MSECKLFSEPHYWDKSKRLYHIKYIPDDTVTYKAFEIGTYYSHRPLYYKIDENKDVVLYSENAINIFCKMELKYLNKLKKFYRTRLGCSLVEVKEDKDKTDVRDVLTDCNIGHFSIGYNETRTIKRAMFREAIAYAKCYCGCLVFFRKRGGLLCYHISRVIANHGYEENKGHHLSLNKGLQLLREINDSGLGEVHLTPLVEEEIVNQMILDEL